MRFACSFLMLAVSALTFNVSGADRFIPLPRSLTEFKRAYGESLHRVEIDGKAFPERTEVYSLRHMNCDITMCFWKPADLDTDLYVHYLRVKSVSGESLSDAQMKHFEVPVAGDAAWRVDTERRGGRTVFLAQKGFTREAWLTEDSSVCVIITGDYVRAIGRHFGLQDSVFAAPR